MYGFTPFQATESGTLGCPWNLGALGLTNLDTRESKGAEHITWALQSCKKLQDRRKEKLVKVPVDKYNYYYISYK